MSIVKYNGKVVKYGSKWVDTGSPTPVILAGTVRFKFSNDSTTRPQNPSELAQIPTSWGGTMA